MISSRVSASASALEFGAGIGTLAQLWQRQTSNTPDCLEIDPSMQRVLVNRNLPVHRTLWEVRQTDDVIYSSNVLEHIEDDMATIHQLHGRLNENGHLAIYVPAFMCLYSDLDRKVGHYRRYAKSELRGKIEAAGFEIVDCRFTDSIGFFASLAIRLLGYKNRSGLCNTRSLRLYDRHIFPLSRMIDLAGARFVFGKNLLLIARKLPSTKAA